MKRQDQKTLKVRETQIPAVAEEHKDKDSELQTYRAPQVFLVGETTNLIAGSGVTYADDDGQYG